MKKNTVSAFLLLSLGLAGLTANAQSTPELRAKVIAQYDQAEVNRVLAELKENNQKNYNKALELAKANGWPLVVKSKDGTSCYLSGVTQDNEPLYKGNDNNYGPSSSTITARVDHLRAGGSLGLDLEGQGMTVGMWEISGPLTTHEQLVGRVTLGSGQAGFSGSDEDALSSSGHATHVAGTLIGSGNGDVTAKGMAPQANLLAYDSFQDNTEALSAANNQNITLLLSNHSYGFKVGTVPEWMQGAYSQESFDWDNVMHAAPYYQAVISAGNDRGGSNTNDLLIGNKTSKNAIVVAAVLGVANYNSPGDVNMSSFSSWGPTDDNRVKPDISMKGVAVHSAYPVNEDGLIGNYYAPLQGTSMASPGVAGTLLLWQQHYSELNGEFMRAATLKALMVNSADEAGGFPGPDQKYGWGLINSKKAIETINGNGETSIVEELVLNPGETYTRQIIVQGDQDLRVTIAWTDPASLDIATGPADGNDPTPKLVNDLDLRVKADGDLFAALPWALGDFLGLGAIKSDNARDNVEDVLISQSAITPGEYTITVKHKNSLKGNLPQRFSLVVNAVTDELNVTDSQYANISVYPNPATDVINIKPGSAVQGTEGSVVMYDLQGRIVRQFNSLVDKVDVSSLTSGMYILNIEYDGYTESKKIMVK